MRLFRHALGLTFVAAACSGESLPDEPDAGDTEPDAGATYADADWLFESDRLLRIEIETADANWDTLRFQTRNILELFGEQCADAPAVSPFTYVEASVTVDGQLTENVGIRKKGFLGSLDDEKPSIKIKFDAFVDGQLFTGTKRMTLNNAKQDPSFMNQCLGYALFNQAGVPAPRCNFATVGVNGDELGVYVHVESVKKPFLAIHYDDNDGNLYEGTLSDFRAGWDATFERKTNKSEPPGSEDRSDIQAVRDALELGDAAMVAELENLIDLDQFFTFWAVESMVSHGDGYSGNNNNFFIYDDPTSGKFSFMPWGADNLFTNGSPDQDPAQTRSALTNRLFLYQPTRQRYLTRYEEILDTVWDDAALLAEIDRIETQVSDSVRPVRGLAFLDGVARLRGNLSGREASMRAGLATASTADAEAVADPLCFDDVGSIVSSFSANYDAGGSTNATWDITINGNPNPLTGATLFVGTDQEVASKTNLIMVATDSGGREVILLIQMPMQDVAPGTHQVGAGLVEALLLFTPPGAMNPDEVYFLSGPLELTTAGTSAGAAWQGTFTMRAWDPPFF